jgi:hypothetical protein
LFSQKQGIAQKLLFEQKKIAAVEKSNQKFAAQASSAGPRIGRGLETGKYTFNSLIESNFFVQTVTNTYIARDFQCIVIMMPQNAEIINY